jgi:glycosyltransferase involved in cell wall biosynthesis
MRIGLVSTVASDLLLDGAASVEALVAFLARELETLGHEVTVFATEGSEAAGEVVGTVPGPYGRNGSPEDWTLCEWVNLSAAVARSGEFDILHSNAYLWGLPLDALARCPMVHTTHVFPYDDDAKLWAMYPDACVTAISHTQWSRYPHLAPTAVIPHGVDVDRHTFRELPQEYVCYLGRFTPGKGPLDAIAAARALDLPIVMAGPDGAYLRERVLPEVDGRSVQYVGFLGAEERDELLGGARALVYPVREAEPFGLVMPEAMLSGTPVAAYAVGAVPEIIDGDVTGIAVSPDHVALTGAVERCMTLDRRAVRDRAEARFDGRAMARAYAAVYEQAAS